MPPVILLADDHSMIRKGLKSSFKFDLGYPDVTDVDTCSGLMKELQKKIYTHLVLDINLSDGSSLEVLPNIRRLYPELHIAVLTMQPASIFQRVLRRYGIRYVMSKAALEEDITSTLRQFLQDDQPARSVRGEAEDNPFDQLSGREMEVMLYLLKNVGTNTIGDALNLKPNTISTFKARILEKTGASNLMELTELAKAHKIIP